MTNKELEAKVINAQSAVAKREAVLAKHREQLAKLIAKGADQYDIRYKEDDIKTATGKLEDARRILKNWQDKLGAQISRDAFIEANAPQVIKDFLERWKAGASIYYRQRRIDFIEYRKELRQKEREARLEALHTLPELERYRQIYKDREPSDSNLANLWPRQDVEEFLKERGLDYRSIREKLAARTDQITNRLGFVNTRREEQIGLEGKANFNIKTPDLEKPIVELSGGNQQKAIVARWMSTKPEVLILDEPTKGIDVGAKSEFYNMICEFAKEGLAVILISSELPEVIGLSDRIIVMRGRRIVGEISAKDATEEKLLSMAMMEEA